MLSLPPLRILGAPGPWLVTANFVAAVRSIRGAFTILPCCPGIEYPTYTGLWVCLPYGTMLAVYDKISGPLCPGSAANLRPGEPLYAQHLGRGKQGWHDDAALIQQALD